MRYIMKQKFWSLGDDFVIRDESERETFHVDGKVFSFGDSLRFLDAGGRERLQIEQKLFNWGPTYEIVRGGRVLAVVKKKLFTFFRCQFTVDVPGPDDLVAEGDFLDHEYTFTHHGRTAVRVSKRWFSWTDTYGIDIDAGEDDELILAAAVVIDLVCHDGDDH